MGGQAFKDFDTPRLDREQYERLRTLALKRLELFYGGIATPASDPGKETYGDVDFVVHSPSNGCSPEAVGAALGAVSMIIGIPTSNYVVPFDGAHSQFDVHICQKEHWEMQVFLHSYGRLGKSCVEYQPRHDLTTIEQVTS